MRQVLLLMVCCIGFACKSKQAYEQAQMTMDRIVEKDISDPSNTLLPQVTTLDLQYIAWGCACAQWITAADYRKYENSDLASHCIFLEPANDSLSRLLNFFDASRHKATVVGQFYEKPDYPKGTIQGEEKLDKAKVFRFTSLRIGEKDEIPFLPAEDTVMTFTFNAISCTCAQWSAVNATGTKKEKEYYYLEPANNRLPVADDLFDGVHLPLTIEVKGQVVSNAGYPTGFAPAKGNPEAATVFKYRSIEIIKKK